MKQIMFNADDVLYALGEALLTADINGKIISVNLNAENLSGYLSADLEGKPLETILQVDVFRAKDGNTCLAELVLAKERISLQEIGTKLVTKDKRIIPIAGTASPVYDHEGKVQGVVLTFRTVAGKGEAEPKRTVNEPDYRNIFAGIGQGFCIIEKVKTTGNQPVDFRYIMANQAFEKHTGVQNVVGKTIREFVPEAEQNVMDILNQVILTGKHQEFETFISTLNFWLKAEVIPTENPDQIAVLFTNISNQKQAETTLCNSETLLKQIINSAQDAVFAIGLNYNFLMCNQRYEQVLKASGSPPFRVGETMLPQHYPPEVLNYWQTAYDRALQGEEFKLETTWPDVDGNTNIFENYFTPLRDAAGTITGALVVSRDVTQRKNAEKNLQESESRFSRLFRSNPVPVGITTASGFRIVDVNEAWTRLTGYSREEAIGHTSSELGLAKPETLQKVGGLVQALGEIRNVEIPLIMRSGDERMVLITSGQIEIDGEPFFLNNLLDITGQKHAEEKLHQSEERARGMLDAIPDLMFRLDRNGTFLDYKADVKDLHEQTMNLIGLRNRDVTPPEFADLIDRKIEETLISRKPQTFEYQLPVPGKGVLDFEARMVPSGDDQVIAIIRNITETKLAQTRLQRSETLLNEMSRIARIGGWELDVATMKQVWTDETYAIHDQDNQTYDPNSAVEISRFEPESKEQLAKAFDEAMNDGKPYDLEVEMTTVKGNRKWLRAVCLPMLENGKVTRLTGTVQDITLRKNAELAKAESERRLKMTLETTSDGFWIVDNNRRFVEVNPAYCAMSGYTRDEFLKLSISDVEVLERVEETQSRIRKIREFGSARFETRHRRKDGSTFDVEVSVNLLESENDLMICICRDITERKLTEEKLRKEKEKLDKIAASAPGLLCSFHQNPDGHHSMPYASAAIKDIYGLEPEDLAGDMTPVFSRVSPEDVEHVNASVIQSAKTMGVWKDEYRYNHPTKGLIWIEGTSTPVMESDGSITWHGFIADITSRKMAEESLHLQSAALNAAANEIFITDTAGRILWVNQAWSMVSGYSAEEAIGKSTRILQSGKQDKAFYKQMWDQIMAGNIWHNEMVNKRKDGTLFYEDLTISPVRNNQGQITHFVGIKQDIAERKQEEKQRIRLAERLNLATRSAQIGIWDWDIVKNELVWDDQMYALYGLQPGEFGGAYEAWLKGLHPDDREASNETSLRAVRGEADYHCEFRVLWPDGSVHWLKADGQVYRDEQGTPVRMVGVNYDISEQKEAIEKLQKSEERFSKVFESNPGAIIVTKIDDGLIVDINRAFLGLFGYTREEVIGHRSTELNMFYDPAERQWMIDLLRQDGYLHDYEVRFNRKSGETGFATIAAEMVELAGEQYLLSMMIDVTGRKRADEKLRESEEKYRGLLESMDSVVATINGDGEFLYMNDIAARWLGGTTEQMTGKTMYQLFPEEVASRQLQNIRQVISENKGMVEEAVSYLSGKPRWFRNSLQPIRDEHGHVTHVLLNSTDIHELKTTQHELAELNQTLEERIRQATSRIQDLYDNAPSGYHSIDNEGKLIMINQTELNWLGYSKEEIIGQPFIKYIAPESHATFHKNFAVFFKQGWINDLELDFIRKDGSTFPVLVNATAIKDEAGNYVKSRSTVIDLTERKQAEQKLQIRESYLSAIIENQPGLIWLKDAESRFLAVNSAFAHSCGKENPELVLGKNDLDIWPADLAQKYRADDAEIIKQGKPRIVEEEIFDQGTRRWFETFKTPVYDQQKNAIGTTGFSRDITMRKQTEEALKLANTELESAIRLKDEFLANMSHELRTPLNAILGLSEILIGQFGGPLNERQLRSLKTIERSGKHLLELITDVLDLSKIQANKMTLDFTFVPVFDVCEASLIFVREAAMKKNIRLTVTTDPEIKLIWADGRRLRQMLINLLSNAVKFTPDNGTVQLLVSGNEATQMVSFSVTDTGIGISQENIQKLFKPFIQVESGLNRQYEGTGLGLALVQRLAQLHSGIITVKSEMGKGSTFTITLPWNDADQPHTAKSQKLEEKKTFTDIFQGETNAPLILLAEDNETNLDVITVYSGLS